MGVSDLWRTQAKLLRSDPQLDMVAWVYYDVQKLLTKNIDLVDMVGTFNAFMTYI